MRVKINNVVPVHLPQNTIRRARKVQAQQEENVNLEDFDYEIHQTSSTDDILNTILKSQQVLIHNQ